MKKNTSISDEKNFYFFYSLNEKENIIDENGNVVIKELEKNNGNFKKSLEEVVDVLKNKNQNDNNCIVISNDANSTMLEGNDKYVVIKVPKKELEEKVINAGEYIFQEIGNKVNEFIEKSKIDEEVLENLNRIDKSKNLIEIKDILKKRYTSKTKIEKKDAKMKKKIKYKRPEELIEEYDSLSEEESLEKNKVIAKLILLEEKCEMKPLISKLNNKLLIKTMKNTYSLSEQIYYGKIKKDEVMEISKEVMDMISLIQQVKGIDDNLVNDLQKELIDFLKSGKNIEISEDSILKKTYKMRKNISINEMYDLTDGKVEYKNVDNIVKDMFQLSKLQLKAREYSEILNKVLNYNPKYKDIIEYIRNNGFVIESENYSKKSSKVNLINSLNTKEVNVLKNRIKELSDEEQKEILENGGFYDSKGIIEDVYSEEYIDEKISKEEYLARTIFSLYDWKEVGISNFKIEEEIKFIEKMKESNIVELYEKLNEKGVEKKIFLKYL